MHFTGLKKKPVLVKLHSRMQEYGFFSRECIKIKFIKETKNKKNKKQFLPYMKVNKRKKHTLAMTKY
jgi:hypothetical protein